MPVNLNAVPVTNTLAVRLALMNGGAIVATLDPGDAPVLTCGFDAIGLFNPPAPPVIRNQVPPAAVTISPGNIGYFANGPAAGTVLLDYGVPNGPQQAVSFT